MTTASRRSYVPPGSIENIRPTLVTARDHPTRPSISRKSGVTARDRLAVAGAAAHGARDPTAKERVLAMPPTTTPALIDDAELLRRYHVEGDRAARQELVERMLPFVRHIARRYANRGEPLDDLIQVGSIGLLKAIDRFQIDRGVKLTSFAEPNVSGEIKRHFRDRGWSVRVPRDLQERHASIAKAGRELSGRLGRSPSAPELAEHLGTSPERVVEALLAGRSYRSSSLDEASDPDGTPRGATLGGDDPEFGRADLLQLIRAGAKVLPPRERRIVFLRYFGDLTQHEIADRVGISQMHVSRLLRSSLERMRRELADADTECRARRTLRAA